MKNIQSLIIALLAIAVGYLLFDKFSETSSKPTSTEEVAETEVDEEANQLRLAYINIDSLNSQYKYIVDQTELLEKETSKVKARIQNKLKQAENRQAELQEQLPGMTQQQFEAAQAEMQKMQYDLQDYESRQSQKLQELQIETQDKIQEQLDSFLTPYKEDYDFIFSYARGTELMHANVSFEITEELVSKMNAAYEASKTDTDKKED